MNVDETWLRYHAYNTKRKTYMWCLVNRKARIVIFFYEDTTDGEGLQKHGGRSRNVLKEFLGDAKIKSLQSDGYNVYMYLDNELLESDLRLQSPTKEQPVLRKRERNTELRNL